MTAATRQKPLSLRGLALGLTLLAFLMIAAMTLLLVLNLGRIAEMAETNRTETIPRALGQHETALLSRQLGLFAEVIAKTSDSEARHKALADAQRLASPILARPEDVFVQRFRSLLVQLQTLSDEAQQLQNSESEVSTQLRQADHLLTSVDVLLNDYVTQLAAQIRANPQQPGQTLDVYFRAIRLQSVFFDMRRRLGMLESLNETTAISDEESYFSGLLMLGDSLLRNMPDNPHKPALEATFEDFRVLGYLFPLQQANLRLQSSIGTRLQGITFELAGISEDITSNASQLASQGADAIAGQAREFLSTALVAIGIMGLLFIATGFAVQLEVVRPTRRAAEALQQLDQKDPVLRLANSDLREMDAINQAVLRLADVLREREENSARLLALAQMKTQFTSNVSHELRTPLTSIRGFIRIIRRDFDKLFLPLVGSDPRLGRRAQRINGDLDIISRESERLGMLIDDVLDLAAVESGRMVWRDQPVDIAEIVDYTRKAMLGEFAQKPELDFIVTVTGPLPVLVLDPHRLQQVLLNLLSNAVKFTQTGSVHLTVTGQGRQIHFAVTDTGPGIPAADHQRIFDAFQQGVTDATPNDRDKTRGTGLGLAISRQIVEHYGGRLTVASTVGQGSTFGFTLMAGQQ